MLYVAVYCPCKWCNFVMWDISVICWISCFSRMRALHQPEPLQLQAGRTWHGWTVGVGTRQGCLVRTCGRVVWSTATRVVFTPVPVLFQFKNLVQFENLMFARSCSRRLLRSRVFPSAVSCMRGGRCDVVSHLPTSLTSELTMQCTQLHSLSAWLLWCGLMLPSPWTLVVLDTTWRVSCLRHWVMLYIQLHSVSSWLLWCGPMLSWLWHLLC